METVGHLIDGKSVIENTATIPLINPATGICESELAMASAEQTRRAIEAASKAYPSWRATPPSKRAQVMFRFKSLLEGHVTEISDLVGREHGKIPHDAKGDRKSVV